MFSSESLMVLYLTVASVIHFELILVCSVEKTVNLTLWHVCIRVFQHPIELPWHQVIFLNLNIKKIYIWNEKNSNNTKEYLVKRKPPFISQFLVILPGDSF